MEEQKKKRRIYYIIAGFVFLILVISGAGIFLERSYSATLDLLVAPLSARIEIDGKEYKNGTYKFKPSLVHVVISDEGFETKEEDVELKADETVRLYTYLVPSDGDMTWYLGHQEDMMILNSVGGVSADLASLAYREKYPVIGILPIIYANYDENWDYTEYRVDGGSFEDCEGNFCLKITDTTGGNRNKALEEIKKRGFNPEDYEIIYKYKPIVPLNNR